MLLRSLPDTQEATHYITLPWRATTRYAVRAVCYLARSGKKLVPVSRLVAALRIPRPFLRKILQRLQRGGILASHRGSGGGFVLAKPVRKIYLMDFRAQPTQSGPEKK